MEFVATATLPGKPYEAAPAASTLSHLSEREGFAPDALALLPRHTVVRIDGNARTRASLIGQRAVVRRAVGLGGWHWLQLASREEVKLQRNALAVLSYPTGAEAESSGDEAAAAAPRAAPPREGGGSHPATPRHAAPRRAAAAYTFAFDEYEPAAAAPKRARAHAAALPPVFEPFASDDDEGKNGGAEPAARRLAAPAAEPGRADLGRLSARALRRYAARHALGAAPGAPADALRALVVRHFAAAPVDAASVLAALMARRQR